MYTETAILGSILLQMNTIINKSYYNTQNSQIMENGGILS